MGTDSGTGNSFSVYYGLATTLTPSILIPLLGNGFAHDEVSVSLSTHLGDCVYSLITVHKYIQKGEESSKLKLENG